MSKGKVVAINEAKDFKGEFKKMGGSNADDWNNHVINQAVNAQWFGNCDEEQAATLRRATVLAVMDIAPKDALEGMMAAQMVAAHSAAMECYKRAMVPEQPSDMRQANLSQANKLSRTFATMVEALNRHRGKGSMQKVTVEHVHIEAGANAVIGNVEGREGGARPELGGQAHAQKQIAAHAPVLSMRRKDPTRDTVPVASNAKRSMSDARRIVDGCAEGQ